MNLPNKISLVRIFLVPVFVTVFLLNDFMPINMTGIIAVCVFALASFTDFLDGYLARKWNMVTTLGKFLDSIADKLLVCAALVLIPIYILPISAFPIVGVVTIACVIIIIAREFMVSALRQAAAAANFIMAADNFGRIKAAVQYFAIIIIMPSSDIKNLAGLGSNAIMYVGFGALCFATLLTILSAVNYFHKNNSLLLNESLTENKGNKQ